MGTEVSKQPDVTGLSNTNVVVEQGMDKVDIAHSILLLIMLALLIMQGSYIVFRQYQRRVKKKYLERMVANRTTV